jgi:hypothetical protein
MMQDVEFQPVTIRPPTYMYKLTIRAGGLSAPHLVIRLDGLSSWKLLPRGPSASDYEPAVPGDPTGTCAGEDTMPRLLFATADSAAWDWGRAPRLERCDTQLLLDARGSPRAPLIVTVYRNLAQAGAIDPRSELGSLHYPASHAQST